MNGTTRPPVLPWYQAYCAAMVLLYLGVAALGVLFCVMPAKRNEEIANAVMGVVFIGMGLVLAAGFVVALLVPRKPWGWVFGMIAICVSLTSCACMAAGIPLLIHWTKPETKAYFGHS